MMRRSAFVRFEDWPELLAAFIEARRSMPFAWGGNDCCTFAAMAIREISGTDFLKDIKPYTTARGARTMVERYGAAVADVADHYIGERMPIQLAQRGDIVFLAGTAYGSLGVCFGMRSWFVADAGLVSAATLECGCAWAI